FPFDEVRAAEQRLALGSQNVSTFFGLPHRRNHIAISASHAYLPTFGGGLLVFPLAGGASHVLDTSTGLPSETIQAALVVDRMLYLWVGDYQKTATFCELDLDSKEVRILAASERKERMSLLDDLTGARCEMLRQHPQDGAIQMLILGGIGRTGIDDRNGLWELNVASGSWTQLQRRTDASTFMSFHPPTSLLLQQSRPGDQAGRTHVEFDCDTRQRRTLAGIRQEAGLPSLLQVTDQSEWWREGQRLWRVDRQTGEVTTWEYDPGNYAGNDLIYITPDEAHVVVQSGARMWIGSKPRFNIE
ncbi:MAG: hypothetical protein KDA90_23225, partial [Planctomycetaceae bacterium]|nr:hypothetical protein [Planctomycetaceae bacterium]